MKNEEVESHMITTLDAFIEAMHRPGRVRDVCLLGDKYFVSYKNQEVKANVVREALAAGLIVGKIPKKDWDEWVLPEFVGVDESSPLEKRRGRPPKAVQR